MANDNKPTPALVFPPTGWQSRLLTDRELGLIKAGLAQLIGSSTIGIRDEVAILLQLLVPVETIDGPPELIGTLDGQVTDSAEFTLGGDVPLQPGTYTIAKSGKGKVGIWRKTKTTKATGFKIAVAWEK